MTNLLMTFESYEPTNQEAYKLFSEMSSKGFFSLRNKRCIEVSRDDLEWCDVVLSIRSTSSLEASLAKYAKKLGKYWILLLDDDFFSLGKDYGQDGQGYREEKKRCLSKVLRYTDCLMASNQNLIEKYSKYGNIKRTYKVETAVDIDHMVSPQEAGSKVKIIYYVNDGTTAMIDKYLRSVFYKLAEIYAGKISLYFIAVHPNLHDLDAKLDIHYVPHMNYEDFLKYIADQHFDIGLAPLDDIGFSKFKYINKFIEYTRAGVAGVYSDCELYKSVIQTGQSGVICENTVDGWVNAISQLVDDTNYKVQIAKGAQNYAREHMSKEAVSKSVLEAIPEFAEYKSPPGKVNIFIIYWFRFRYWLFRIRGWIFTVYSCVRSGNIKGLVRRINRKLNQKK